MKIVEVFKIVDSKPNNARLTRQYLSLRFCRIVLNKTCLEKAQKLSDRLFVSSFASFITFMFFQIASESLILLCFLWSFYVKHCIILWFKHEQRSIYFLTLLCYMFWTNFRLEKTQRLRDHFFVSSFAGFRFFQIASQMLDFILLLWSFYVNSAFFLDSNTLWTNFRLVSVSDVACFEQTFVWKRLKD